MTILAAAHGMFGPIQILDDGSVRSLVIGSQVQGSVFCAPPASSVAPNLEGPGPVFGSPYCAGLLLAGLSNQSGSGLMVGLGAGACTVALLSNFPDLDLTVVEIDPKVVELASQYFPLVGHYQDEGRLTIVTHDATEYLLQALMDEDQWDFGILDAYSGSNDPHVPHELLTLAAETCQAIWLNVIDRPQGATVRHVQEVLTVAEKPIQFVAAANQPAFLGVTNLTLATQSPESETARKFIPYRDMSGLGVDTARRHYQVVAEQAS